MAGSPRTVSGGGVASLQGWLMSPEEAGQAVRVGVSSPAMTLFNVSEALSQRIHLKLASEK